MPDREYHYVLTVQAPAVGGQVTRTFDGVIGWDNDRQDAYYNRFNNACEQMGVRPSDPGIAVLCWSFEPNDL